MTTKGKTPAPPGAPPPDVTGPVSPYDETRVGLAKAELAARARAGAAPSVGAATMVEAFDPSSLDLSDLPSMSADELGGFSMEGQTFVSPPMHSVIEPSLEAARRAVAPSHEPSVEEETETYDLPVERAASMAEPEPPTFDVARRLLDEAATLLRACALQTGAPAADLEPSVKGALQRIEHVRWIIGKGGSRG
jgi:hypothetical protein